ncbi:MAG TPA: type II toxin-antitoxin system RelE/ParE family toxin [Candidatus Acidoferrales bacterium]|jgi:phage-related protein|nr:type II toxin-antitoxin system RelE/ParE family toxin [Candidatus Acidoferrales bacterium]
MVHERLREIPVRFYRTTAGVEPVLEWLHRLDKGDRHAIGLDLMRVQFGWPIGMPLMRSLKSGLWEVRSTLPSQKIARLIVCFHQNNLIVLHGFIKKPKRTPREDIDLAMRRKAGGYSVKKKKTHIGSSLNDFLKEEGILEEARATALKEALAWQVQNAMKKEKINKVEMARRMKTSRAALDRLLDPGYSSVTLQTLCKAARAVGRDLRIELV